MQQYRPMRVAASLPVEIYSAPYYPPLRMRMQNISTGGMFIRTSLEFQVGEILLCKTWLPNMDTSCLFISRVARSFMPGQDTWDMGSGLGLQFLHGSDSQRERLREFVFSANVSMRLGQSGQKKLKSIPPDTVRTRVDRSSDVH